MAGGEPDDLARVPTEATSALQGEQVRGIRHHLRAAQGRQNPVLARESGDRASAERRHRRKLEGLEAPSGGEEVAVQLDQRALVDEGGTHEVVAGPLPEKAGGHALSGPTGHDVEEQRPHRGGGEALRQRILP